jgi:hypothetical protein
MGRRIVHLCAYIGPEIESYGIVIPRLQQQPVWLAGWLSERQLAIARVELQPGRRGQFIGLKVEFYSVFYLPGKPFTSCQSLLLCLPVCLRACLSGQGAIGTRKEEEEKDGKREKS